MTINSANPAFRYQGADDQSTATVPVEARPSPVFLAYSPLFTQRGPTDPNYGPIIVDKADFDKIFGAESLQYRSKYMTHQAVLTRALLEAGGLVAVERIAPNDLTDLPKTAMINLAVDVLAMNIPQYERNTDGSFKYDEDGLKIPLGTTKPGYKYKFVLAPLVGAVGAEVERVGSMTEGATQSTIKPLMDIPAAYFGIDGNNIGFSLFAPTDASSEPVDRDRIERVGSYINRFAAIRRASTTSLGTVAPTINGERFVEFSLDPDAFDPLTESELAFDRVIADNYRNLMPNDGSAPVFGPYGDIYVYRDKLDGLLEDLHSAEAGEPTLASDTGIYAFNLFGAASPSGEPYYTAQIVGVLDGGVEFTETSNFYLEGGKDGLMTAAHYEARVGEIFDNMSTGFVRYEDMGRYPFTCVVDSGFTLPTKNKLPQIMSVRRDVVVLEATQDVAQPQNTISEESSIAAALRSALRLHPESTYYGTPTCRGAIIGQSSYLLNSTYRKLVPGTFEVALKLQRYMGGDRFQNSASLNLPQNRNLQFLAPQYMNCTSKPNTTLTADWSLGLVSARFKDDNTLFYPAFKTVYDDDTSVLNSILIAFILGDVVRGCYYVWTQLTGREDLSEEQLAQESDRLILLWVQNKYDNLVEITPRTNFTTADRARGYSWSTEVTIRGRGQKNVNTTTIIARRIEEEV